MASGSGSGSGGGPYPGGGPESGGGSEPGGEGYAGSASGAGGAPGSGGCGSAAGSAVVPAADVPDPSGAGPAYDVVVLAGGAARRLGGADKPALAVGGRALLDRVLAACAGAAATVVVGPRRPTARPVRWAREEPPGGGPLPALAAGLAELDRLGAGSGTAVRPGVVVVLAADLPFLTSSTVAALAGTALRPPGTALRPGGVRPDGPDGRDGVLLVDAAGRDQPLAAAYRVEPLRRELALLRGEHGGLAGLPLRLLVGELAVGRLPDPGAEAFDCDTWEDVAAARSRLGDCEGDGEGPGSG